MALVLSLLASLVLPISASPFGSVDVEYWKRQTAPSQGTIEWQSCQGFDERFSCAVFPVPLNYADRSAGRGQVFVAKFAAQGERVGTLFTNPGGPGQSGVNLVFQRGEELSDLSGGGYDIVSWDPRGVGQVTFPGEVQCFSSFEDYARYFDGSIVFPRPDVRGNFTEEADIAKFFALGPDFDAKIQGLARQCFSQPAGRFLQFVGTAATVRDMVSLANAIEGANTPINYWGLSYGTVIGNFFVNMFPGRVGRVILDGVIDPVFHSAARSDFAWATRVESTDEAFQGFANACTVAGPANCRLADPAVNGGKDIISWAQDLIDLAYDLVQVGRLEVGTSTRIRAMIQSAMFSPRGWSQFANEDLFFMWRDVTQIAQDAASGLSARSDEEHPSATHIRLILKRQQQRTAAPNFNFAAITCGDSINPGGTTTRMVFEEVIRSAREVSGTFTPQVPQPAHMCHIWPARAVERYSGPFDNTPANPILVIGNTADPTTPFKDAQSVADKFGDSATLIEQQGFGHITLAQRSACTNKIITDYFVDGTRPEGDDTICLVDDAFTNQFFSTSVADISNDGADISNDGADQTSQTTTDGADQASQTAENEGTRKQKNALLTTTISFAVATGLLLLGLTV